MNAPLYEPLSDIPLKSLDGRALTLAQFKGQVLLIVNVASKCGLTPQYSALETLFENYRDRGLQVWASPATTLPARNRAAPTRYRLFARQTSVFNSRCLKKRTSTANRGTRCMRS